MRNLVWALAVLVGQGWGAGRVVAEDWQILDPDTAQAYAEVLAPMAEKVEKPQVQIAGDVAKSTGVNRDQIGLVVVPQNGLSGIPSGAREAPGAPIAHLFLSPGLVPLSDGKPIDPSKMRTLTFTAQDGSQQKVNYLALAARLTEDRVWHLYGYGTEEEPVLDTRISSGRGPGILPIAVEVRNFEDNQGRCYVTIYDSYQAYFPIRLMVPADAPAAAAGGAGK